MENIGKIFTPTIQRTKSSSKNDLYDLINVIPAPYKIASETTKNGEYKFTPNTEKYYIQKKRSKLKVKTVRDIRKLFEDDTFLYLSNELERQQSTLLRKIRCGTSRDEETKALAKKILKSDTPISRPAWQMLVNINPDLHPYPKQYVIWNDKYIQVNGSKGGREKNLCKYNLAQKNIGIHKNNIFKKSMTKRKGLLRNSLAVKFKPGPLRRKKFLDVSHQKYHVGDIDLINLPKPGLDILPTVGTALDPTIASFLNKLRHDNGIISQKWAEMAVSVLSTIDKKHVHQTSKEYVSFDLGYKFDQHRILMRRDVESLKTSKTNYEISQQINLLINETTVLPEVQDIMSRILDAVEISANQDSMFSVEDDIFEVSMDDVKQENVQSKDTKVKRKFCELGRLDVTVIRLPRESQNSCAEKCNKSFCSLGCICDSLAGTVNLKRHCGRLDCMFKCKCDFSKYGNIHSGDMDYDLLPGLVHFDTELNSKLSKEEQKFHQTVVVTDEKSIVLKSQKRNSKIPKKYAEFYDNWKQDGPRIKPLAIVAIKLDCQNVEPWCMVHNLYKCFCKGMFTQFCKSTTTECVEDGASKNKLPSFENKDIVDLSYDESDTCSRVNTYVGRKFDDVYYKETNDKILRMEENDASLSNKLQSIISKSDKQNLKSALSKNKSVEKCSESTSNKELEVDNKVPEIIVTPKANATSNIKTYSRKIVPVPATISDATPSTAMDGTNTANINQIMTGIDEVLTQPKDACINTRSKTRRLPNKTKLVAWLETNYKMFKERVDQGLNKIYLAPPKVGKVALYPWHFILDRYRERKNLFLISKSKPYRIFMAVHSNIPTLENCVNINDIRFAELHNYPVTVKNLLTNATELKDNFCILCGLTGCWEVIGSVTKVNESESTSLDPTPSNIENTNCFDLNATWDDTSELDDDMKDSVPYNNTELDDLKKSEDSKSTKKSADDDGNDKSPILIENSLHSRENSNTSNDTSKWFVMTVENDFSEIRFYKRGFFVKYESIVKAINVARISAKTVRLSSQKCVDKNNGPQFGIYAIPNANEYCVFVGPYDIEESLGIETIKTIMDVMKVKRTRGFWITTSKVDNMRVIDNPLSFMPFSNSDTKNTLTLDQSFCSNNEQGDINTNKTKQSETHDANSSNSKTTIRKVVKPIKIRKTNGFYHLASNGVLKKITPPNVTPSSGSKSLLLDSNKAKIVNVSPNLKRDAPQELSPIKITSVYSIIEGPPPLIPCNSNVPEKSMLILKPEEINKKVLADGTKSLSFENNVLNNLENGLTSEKDEYLVEKSNIEPVLTASEVSSEINSTDHIEDSNIETDIKLFLKSPVRSSPSCDDVCVISDDEDEHEAEEKRCAERRRLWMESFKSDMITKDGLRKSTKSPNKDLAVFLPSTSKQDHAESTNETSTEETSFVEDSRSTSPHLADELMPWNQADAQSSTFLTSLANAPDNVKRSMSEALNNIMSLVKDVDED